LINDYSYFVDFNAYKSHEAVSAINGDTYMTDDLNSGEIVISDGSLRRTIRPWNGRGHRPLRRLNLARLSNWIEWTG